MTWTEHFVTGIPAVDGQHRGLVEMINAVAPYLAPSGPMEQGHVEPLLDRLFAYAGTHFREEEEMMAARGIDHDYLRGHHQGHTAFVAELVQMRRQLEDGVGLDGPQLLRFLTSWLTFHILGEDQKMAHQLRLIDGGLAAAVARREVRDVAQADSANAVLNAALLDLFALNKERNEALSVVNAKLKVAQADLTILNAGLELQVQARTAELVNANAALGHDRAALEAAILDLRQTQTALIEAEKLRAVGQLAAGLAHEINTPVQFVGDSVTFMKEGFDALAELLQGYKAYQVQSPEVTASIRELEERLDASFILEQLPAAVERSQQGLARVSELVSAIMEFSKPDAGDRAPTNLNQVLANCLTVVRGQIADVAALETRFGEIPPVTCRIGELKQAFVNLLANAADAIRDVVGESGAKGRIEVGTRLEGDRVVVWVSDTGTGIPADVAPRIFEPFYTTKDVGKGVGQGLSVCRSVVVDRHGGAIDFETAAGVGTTFYVRLPPSASST